MLRRLLCQLLIALTAWAPFHMAQASMIGTEQVTSGTADQQRAHVMGILNRAETAAQMQAMGVDVQAAKDRVAAMTDEEVGALADRMDAMPAGALHGWGSILVLAIIVGAIWWVATRNPR